MKQNPQRKSLGMVDCPVTGNHLYVHYKDDSAPNPLTSYGRCVNCGVDFHESALHGPAGLAPSTYTIVWEGRWCKECWKIK